MHLLQRRQGRFELGVGRVRRHLGRRAHLLRLCVVHECLVERAERPVLCHGLLAHGGLTPLQLGAVDLVSHEGIAVRLHQCAEPCVQLGGVCGACLGHSCRHICLRGPVPLLRRLQVDGMGKAFGVALFARA
eukprot:scaffold71989_cov61-Phaeocystis_antarctica.AAC.4